MLNKKDALELNASGIHDFVRNQHASWDNVRGIKDFFDGNGPAIGVLLYNNKKFLNDKIFLRKFLYYAINLRFGTPFLISLQPLAGDDDSETIEVVKNYFNQICKDYQPK